MDERPPPPSYDDVLKGSGMPGPMLPAQCIYPPVQGISGTQPPSGSSFPQYTYSTVNTGFASSGGYPYSTAHAGFAAPGSGQPYQQPSNQVGNTAVTAYQHPVVVSTGNFQMVEPTPPSQNFMQRLCFMVAMCTFTIVIIIVVVNAIA